MGQREREEAERRKQRNGRIVAGAMVGLSAAIVIYALTAGGEPSGPSKEQLRQLRSAAAAAGCSVASFPSEGRTHTEKPVTYRTNPPTSGNHNAAPAPDRVYTTAPPKENYVHSLEHGRIELQYKPGSPATVVNALRAVFEHASGHMLLFPNNTGMEFEVAATAWKHRLGCPRFNASVPAAIIQFRDAYRDRAPEKVP